MVTASHYILRDVLSLMERDRTERLEEVCSCYAKRYSSDEEFQELVSQILLGLETDDNGILEGLKPKISELITTRKIETSGGTKLWFRDRR